MTAEVVHLTEELRSVRLAVDKVGQRLDWLAEEYKAEHRKSKRHRLGSAVLAVVVFTTAALFVRDLDEAERVERRACLSSNRARADIRASIVETVMTLGATADDPDRVAAIAERIARRLDETLPDRSC